MKARVKATGEIVEVVRCDECMRGIVMYKTTEGDIYLKDCLEFDYYNNPDYWARLEHQYAGMAMQAMLTSPELMQVVTSAKELLTNEYAKRVAVVADKYALALVEKMKEKNND